MPHPVGKQVYKLELSKKWKIYDVFHVSLLEQDIIKKRQVDKNTTELNADDDNSKKYKVEVIWDSAIYAKESKSGHLPGLYYLVLWKRYLEKQNTGEPASVVQYLRKLISSFYKDHSDKPTATSFSIDTTLLMARPTVKLTIKPTEPSKQKQERPANSINKQAKKN